MKKIISWICLLLCLFMLQSGVSVSAAETGLASELEFSIPTGENNVEYGDPVSIVISPKTGNLSSYTFEWGKWVRNDTDRTWSIEPLDTTGNTFSVDRLERYTSVTCLVRSAFSGSERFTWNLCIDNSFSFGYGADQFVELGGTANLTNMVYGSDLSDVRYRWYEVENYGEDERYTIMECTEKTLSVPNVTMKRTFVFEAIDRYDNVIECYLSACVQNKLNVFYNNQYSHSTSFSVPYGETKALTASITANDLSEVTWEWSKEGDPAWSPSSGQATSQTASSKITAKLVTDPVTDKTVYICTAHDQYDNVSTCTFTLTVDNQLRVTADGPSYAQVVPGGSFTMKVKAEAIDTTGITYQWEYQAPSQTTGGVDRFIDETKTGPVETIEDIQWHGQYNVKVTDRFGNFKVITFSWSVINNLGVASANDPGSGSYSTDIEQSAYDPLELKVVVTWDNLDGIKISWDYDDGYILDWKVSEDGTTLTMEKPESGPYLCTVKDRYGNSASHEFRVYLDYSLTMNKEALTICVKDSEQLSVEQNAPLRWSCNPEGIVSVDSNGRVTGLRPGFATVTASNADYDYYSASCEVSVLFRDVKNTDQYYFRPVYWAVGEGITNGYTDNKGNLTGYFGPTDTCDRAQIVTFLYRAAGEPEVDTAAALSFKDVKQSDYFFKAVAWAASEGITTGYTDKNGKPTGKFGSHDPCTRAQIVTFLYRAAGEPVVDTAAASSFKDVKQNDYFFKAVIWAAQNEITTGYTDSNGNPTGVFGSNDPCTRGQVVTFLYRAD